MRYQLDDAAFSREKGRKTYKGIAAGWRHKAVAKQVTAQVGVGIDFCDFS